MQGDETPEKKRLTEDKGRSDAPATDGEGASKTSDIGGKNTITRREWLRIGTAAAAATATAGMAVGGAAAIETVSGISFQTVLDAVDDLGMDPNGNEPIDDKLASAIKSNTLVEFPPGDYLATDTHVVRGLTNFGIRGAGDAPEDVRFVFPDGNRGSPDPENYVMLWLEGDSGVLLENFELHQTDDKRTAASLVVYAGDALELHDIVWQGFNPLSDYAKGTCCYPSVTQTDGVGHVSNITIRDGGVVGTYPDRRMGFLMQGNHEGELIFSNLDLRELGSTALRGTRCAGTVKVEDSYFENNDNGSIRFGGNGHPSKQSWAKRCRVVVDGSLVQHLESGEAYEDIDACRIDSNGNGWTGALVENCEFVYRSLPGDLDYSRGVISRPSWGDHGGFTVRDTTIRVDADGVPAINIPTPGDTADTPHKAVFENVHITGEQSSNFTDSVVTIKDSDGSVVRNCCINLPNSSLNGVSIVDSNDCIVESSSINVGGAATDFSNSTVESSGITSDGTCRLPSGSIDDESSNDGSTSDGGSDDGSEEEEETSSLANTLTIRGTGSPANYSFSVDGDLEPATADSLEEWDSLSDSSAEGWVTETSDVDSFGFSGSVTDFSFLEGEAEIELNGEVVTVEDILGDDGSEEEEETSSLANTLTIRGTGSPANYSFSVDGDLEPATADSLEEWDSLSDSSAEGWVTETSDVDSFGFSGSVTDFSFLEGEAEIELNGEVVTVEDLLGDDGSEEEEETSSLANTLTIRGTGSPANYSFSVDGDLEPATADSLEEWDSLSDSSAEGWVTETGDTDTYAYTGSIVDFSFLEGEADVELNGDSISVDELALGDSGSELSANGENYLFTSQSELQAIADKALDGTDPWMSAWEKVRTGANDALDIPLQSVTDDDGSHYFTLERNDRHDYREAIRTGDRVRNLALAYFVTGEDRYAEKAIDQIHHWFLDENAYQYPTGSGDYGVEQYITIPKFLMGAALLRGHSYWDNKSATMPWNGEQASTAEDALAAWAVTWANSLTEPNHNNIWVWLAVAEASAAAYAGDDTLFQSAVDRYKSDPAWNDYNDDGSFQAELNRENGYRYQLFRMKAHATFCELARHRGVDLYSYNGLKRSFDWMAHYVMHPEDWEWGTGSLDWDRTHEAPGAYELAHSIWGETAYRDVIDVGGRPVDDGRLLQWITFSHGDLFALPTDTILLPHAVTIDGTGSTSSYRIEVSEEAVKVTGDSNDTVSGTTIEGSVTDKQDVYEFAGIVTEMAVDGTVAVTFDS